jgi:acetylcholinesterase
MILGDLDDEGTLFVLGTNNITTRSDLDGYLSAFIFPHTTAQQRKGILDLYPVDPIQGSPFGTGLANMVTPQNKRIAALLGVSGDFP